MRTASTDMVDMTLHDDGVVVVVEKNPAERHTPESMIADVATFRDLTDNQALPALWDVRAMSRPTPEGWKAFLEAAADALSALALVVDERSRQIAGSYPAVMDSFLFPSRVFEQQEEAYEWLLQHVPADFTAIADEPG